MDALFFHPKLVHLPIALGVLMPLVAGGLLLAWWRDWLPRRTWLVAVALQAALVASGVAAIRSGEAAEERVEHIVPERFIHAHEEAAEAFVWGSAVVLGLMASAAALGQRRSARALAAAATLGTLVVFGLGYRTGEAGGSLVYEHGAAQAYLTSPASATGSAGGASTNGDGDDD